MMQDRFTEWPRLLQFSHAVKELGNPKQIAVLTTIQIQYNNARQEYLTTRNITFCMTHLQAKILTGLRNFK